MLGENHSLLNEFPEFAALIKELTSSNQLFAERAKQYNELDDKIRKLELANSPIGDSEMQKMKHDRSQLKDVLYKTLSMQREE